MGGDQRKRRRGKIWKKIFENAGQGAERNHGKKKRGNGER